MCQIQCFIEHIHFLFIISSHSLSLCAYGIVEWIRYSFKALYLLPARPGSFTSFTHSLTCSNSDNIDNSHQWKTNASASVKGPIAINIHWLHISLTHTAWQVSSSCFFWFPYVLCSELIAYCIVYVSYECIHNTYIHKCVRAYILIFTRIFWQWSVSAVHCVVESIGFSKIIPLDSNIDEVLKMALNKEIIVSLTPKHLLRKNSFLFELRTGKMFHCCLFVRSFVCVSEFSSNRIDVFSILARFMSHFHFNFPANIASFAPSKFTNSLKSKQLLVEEQKKVAATSL